MAGTVFLTDSDRWDAAGWLFDWAIDTLAAEAPNGALSDSLTEITAENLGTLDLRAYPESERRLLLRLIATRLPVAANTLPASLPERERSVAHLRQLAESAANVLGAMGSPAASAAASDHGHGDALPGQRKAARGTAFQADERRQLLNEYFDLHERLLRAARDGLTAAQADELRRRSVTLTAAYREGVPVVPVARCPFTGELAEHSVDDLGLDGLWWDARAGVRPRETLPATFLALTGAVRLRGDVAFAPFLCKPGPEPPFVLPRMLRHPDVQAILRPLAVGAHQGYAVTYFARHRPADLRLVNEWGLNYVRVPRPDGIEGWDEVTEWPGDWDFDLRPWLDSGKLHWVAEDDDSLTLRQGSEGCPYLDLDGNRNGTRIERGKVWFARPLTDSEREHMTIR